MEYVEQFDHITHMNAITDSRFFIQHDGCLWKVHVHMTHTINIPHRYRRFIFVEYISHNLTIRKMYDIQRAKNVNNAPIDINCSYWNRYALIIYLLVLRLKVHYTPEHKDSLVSQYPPSILHLEVPKEVPEMATHLAYITKNRTIQAPGYLIVIYF